MQHGTAARPGARRNHKGSLAMIHVDRSRIEPPASLNSRMAIEANEEIREFLSRPASK
jgi:hypothetical protein